MKKINKNTTNHWIVLGCFFLLALSALVVVAVLGKMNFQPSGNDVWSHLYKGDMVYHNLMDGKFYQLYSERWYNGTQLFRYWAPFSYYSFAGMEFLSGGDILVAYRYFAGFSIIVGGIPWILWGRDSKRPLFATGIALLWFFFPENIRVYMCEGNLPRMMSAMIIPYVVYFIWRYLRQNKRFSLLGVVISTTCMLLSHVMITAMLGVATFVFLMFELWRNRNLEKVIKVLAAMLIGLMLMGIWLMPALSGGIMEMDSGASLDVMALWMGDLSVILNPFNRINGVVDTFYYGILILALAIAGMVLAKKGRKSGFLLFILIVLMTTPEFIPFFAKMPMNTLFWMSRFATIAYGFFLFSLMEWKTLKKKYCVVVLVILFIECIPSFNFQKYAVPASDTVVENTQVLKENTTYRTAMMDLSQFGSYPSWGLSTGEDAVNSTFGWAWQGATTSSNIVMLNTAFEYEAYDYLFDRCVEMGNDTVLVKKDLIGKKGHDDQDVFEGAGKSGYVQTAETKTAYIFKKETPEKFAVKSVYSGLALGRYANIMTMYYPAFCEGDSEYVDEYTLEELTQYKTIFLSGIFYHDKKQAEGLLQEAAKEGVRIVVDITHVQEDSSTKQLSFLGVTSQSITIQDRYPALYYGDERIGTKDFSEDYAEWFTGYIGNVDTVLGKLDYEGQELTWLGTRKSDPNIYFVGLNVMYHALETDDIVLFEVMDDILSVDRSELPQRTLVPMQMEIHDDEIIIQSEEENINTTLAYQDNFVSDSEIWQENNLLFVKDKETHISIVYPKKNLGIAVSVLGVLATIVLLVIQLRRRESDEKGHIDNKPGF